MLRWFLKPVAGAPIGAAAVAGCWSAHQGAELFEKNYCLAMLALGLAVLLADCALRTGQGVLGPGDRRPRSVLRVPAPLLLASVFVCFLAFTQLRAHLSLAERLDPADEGQNIELIGIVEDLPNFFEQGVRFGLRVEQCLSEVSGCRPAALYRLGWYFGRDSQTRSLISRIQPGRRLQLQVRLKQVHAAANPGLFDAELRALEDGVSARGYVRRAMPLEPARMSVAQMFAYPMITVNQFRHELRETMLRALHSASDISKAVTVALVVGDQSAIGASAWEMFNRTGIGHLISISGLHITMLAGIAHKLTSVVWHSKRLYRLCGLVLPGLIATPIAARWVSVVVAFAYSALAGWGIPAQRTCWMLAFALLATLGNRNGSALNIVCAALLAVLLIDPWAVLAAGFWLSFAAVAAIVWYGSSPGARRARSAWLQSLIDATRAQWAVTVALVPLGALFFSSVSLIGPLANSFAIPVVSFVITPLALAGALLVMILPTPGQLLLNGAALGFDGVVVVMKLLDRLDQAVWILPMPTALALACSAFGIFVLLSRLLPSRTWGLTCLLPVLTQPALAPTGDQIWVTALDVGQGMAVLIETGNGRLLYDAGPAYGIDSDAGQRVVAPYLRARGITTLQAMTISHKDVDHSGGAVSVLRNVRVERLITSLSSTDALIESARDRQIPVEQCVRGAGWQWGEVRFEWLHPGAEVSAIGKSTSNSMSCVLKISSPAGSVLLTGDIEAAQERQLLASLPDGMLDADVLLAPHHGSQTSSSQAFLDAVSPSKVIFQLGYRNRFKHPHPKVWQRYEKQGAELLRSDWHGAIQIRLRAGEEQQVVRWRTDAPRYWRVCAEPGQCRLAPEVESGN